MADSSKHINELVVSINSDEFLDPICDYRLHKWPFRPVIDFVNMLCD